MQRARLAAAAAGLHAGSTDSLRGWLPLVRGITTITTITTTRFDDRQQASSGGARGSPARRCRDGGGFARHSRRFPLGLDAPAPSSCIGG